jgi:hypothetical protein
MSNIKYVIINANEVSLIDFNQVLEASTNSLRYNNDNTQTLVKFIGNTPDFLEGKTQYTHSEIKSILNSSSENWIPEEDPIEDWDDED